MVISRVAEYNSSASKYSSLKSAPDKVIMESLTRDELTVGRIVVTRGGVATLLDGKVVGWGFERCRIISIDDVKGINLKTAWGTEIRVPIGYCLYGTTETVERRPFPLLMKYTIKRELTFKEALEMGITTLDNDSPSAASTIVRQTITVSEPPVKVPVLKDTPKLPKPPKTNSKLEFHVRVIEVFAEFISIMEASKKLGTSYQNVRNALHRIAANPVDGRMYSLLHTDGARSVQYQLVEVRTE